MSVIAEGYNAFETNKSPSGTIKYLPDPPSVMALIRSGKIKEHILLVRGGTTTFLTMEEKQVGRVLTPVSTYIGNIASGTLFASNDLIKKNPDGLRAFLAAWLDTTTYMRTHKDETVKIESEVTNHDEAVMAKDYDITIGMFTSDCRFDKESLANLSRSFVELHQLDTAPDMSKLYTEAYLSPSPGGAH